MLLVWAVVTFGVPYFALHLRFTWFGAPFSLWMTAQGALLVYFLIVACYGITMNRLDSRYEAAQRLEPQSSSQSQAP